MHNLTDNIIRNAIKIKLNQVSNPFLIEIVFGFYILSRYLGFLMNLIRDIIFPQQVASLKANKAVCARKPRYGFEHGAKVDLSVIIAAYNAEKYIKKCIESITKQNVTYNYEIIVVNDCSSDKTKNILDEFKGCRNIRIFNQEKNQGVSATRNLGIYHSVGEYLMFLDADDFLYDDCIEKALEQCKKNNLDIAEFSYFRFKDENAIHAELNHSGLNAKVLTDFREILDVSSGYVWAKLYKREIFKNIRFPEGILFEDPIIHKIVFRLCKRYMHLGCIGYLYRDAPNSITKSIKNKDLAWEHLYMIQYCLDEANRLGVVVDHQFYRLLVLEAGSLLKSRSFYLSVPDLLFIFAQLTHVFNAYDQGFDLTLRERLIVMCIKKKYIHAWKWIAF